MTTQEELINKNEIEQLVKLKSAKLETDEDSITLSDFFDEDAEVKIEEHKPETEQSLEFLTGGERYTQD